MAVLHSAKQVELLEHTKLIICICKLEYCVSYNVMIIIIKGSSRNKVISTFCFEKQNWVEVGDSLLILFAIAHLESVPPMYYRIFLFCPL